MIALISAMIAERHYHDHDDIREALMLAANQLRLIAELLEQLADRQERSSKRSFE